MGSSLNSGPFFGIPIIVRHPYKKDPKRDPTLENYPDLLAHAGAMYEVRNLPTSSLTEEMTLVLLIIIPYISPWKARFFGV